jgi:hypothetical protein
MAGIVRTQQPRGAIAVYLCEAGSDDGLLACELAPLRSGRGIPGLARARDRALKKNARPKPGVQSPLRARKSRPLLDDYQR